MQKIAKWICNHVNLILIISGILLVLSFIGMKLTRVNYDILVYLPKNIDTIKGQDILTKDFDMGSYSIAAVDNMNSDEILKIEEDIKEVDGVNNVVSIYDVLGTAIPMEILPSELADKVHNENSDILFITFADSTSAERTINAVKEIRKITDNKVSQGGMSSMVLDTMELSEKEITIYIVIAVILCIVVLELALDSYVVPFILLANIGCSILFNLGSNVFLGDISYITKALVAVLQLGVTTDFSIFLYHSYEKQKKECKSKIEAMEKAIGNTFTSVTGSSLTTIAGFLVLCTMQLTLGRDLGIVMAKGVLLGVITVLTLFPSLILVFDKIIEKTKHKKLMPNFTKLNQFIIKHHVVIFVIFLILIVPAYLANSKIDVYYKLDKSLPETLESIKTNKFLKDNYNIVSPEIILFNKDLKTDDVKNMTDELKSLEGIDLVLSYGDIKSLGFTEEMMDESIVKIFESDKYQMMLINSEYDIATDELNSQTEKLDTIVKKYDDKAIVAGEGPLMKDLVKISDSDFNNVNYTSILCIFVILFFVLKSFSLPFLLIASIEFAIFMNMGVSYFNGTVLPFIAPIVLGTIQLGATIDYAILMTTTYLTHRKEGKDKNDAMLETLNYCGPSILTSGMCFFGATFGVGLYSAIEMIGSLCTLISRGAIISMIVVITILPAILLIFDKLIIKTTINVRKEGKKMKNNKKVMAVLSLLLILLPLNAKAISKDETVYSKLNYDGSIKKTIVNERIINDTNEKIIEDKSELTDILNIGNDVKYKLDKETLIWEAGGKDIFYRGSTTKVLPINAKITYKLNGEEKAIDEIIGKAGKVSIIIKYTNSDKHYINGNLLYTPFVVTTGTIIDSENNSNISVTNGKIINTGTKNMVVAITSPGLYESLGIERLRNFDTVEITYDTKKFELSSIYSVATSKVLENSDLNIENEVSSLYKSFDELKTNMDSINDGSNKVKEGSNLLKETLGNSISNLKNNNDDALNEEQVSDITKNVTNNVESKFTDAYNNEIGTSAANAVGAMFTDQYKNQIATAAENSVKEKFTEGYKNQIANATWQEVQANMGENATIAGYVGTATITSLVAYITTDNNPAVTAVLAGAGKTTAEFATIVVGCVQGNAMACAGVNALQTAGIPEATINNYKSLAGTLIAQIGGVASNTANLTAEEVSKSVAVSVAENTAIETAKATAVSSSEQAAKSAASETAKSASKKAALETASSVSKSLAPTVANEVKNAAMDKVTESLETLYNGVSQLDSGINTLDEGITKYNKEGITKLSDTVNTTLKPVVRKVSDLKTLSEEYSSFVGTNTKNTETKFILVVDSKKAKTEKVEKETKKENISLWQRFINLFK